MTSGYIYPTTSLDPVTNPTDALTISMTRRTSSSVRGA